MRFEDKKLQFACIRIASAFVHDSTGRTHIVMAETLKRAYAYAKNPRDSQSAVVAGVAASTSDMKTRGAVVVIRRRSARFPDIVAKRISARSLRPRAP
jgi:hypothetical protein